MENQHYCHFDCGEVELIQVDLQNDDLFQYDCGLLEQNSDEHDYEILPHENLALEIREMQKLV